MTTENYVNAIVKQLKCSRRKRKEIKQQLLSDIAAAIENGETAAAIMARMGSAKEAAAEFNQNLSPTEQKHFSRSRKIKAVSSIIIVLALLLLFLVYWFLPKSYPIGTSGAFDEKTVEQEVQKIIQLLDARDYPALRAASIPIMQKVLENEQQIEDVKENLSRDWGSFRSFGTMYMAEIKQRGQLIAYCEVTASYENTNVTYTLLFDKELRLAGLYMK